MGRSYHTFSKPRSNLEVVAQRLATTEQSVNTSCTRSVFSETDTTGVGILSTFSTPIDSNSWGRFQPAKMSCCKLDKCRSGSSLYDCQLENVHYTLFPSPPFFDIQERRLAIRLLELLQLWSITPGREDKAIKFGAFQKDNLFPSSKFASRNRWQRSRQCRHAINSP